MLLRKILPESSLKDDSKIRTRKSQRMARDFGSLATEGGSIGKSTLGREEQGKVPGADASSEVLMVDDELSQLALFPFPAPGPFCSCQAQLLKPNASRHHTTTSVRTEIPKGWWSTPRAKSCEPKKLPQQQRQHRAKSCNSYLCRPRKSTKRKP